MSKGQVYVVEITPHAVRSLKKLKRDRGLLERIDKAIGSLARDPRPPGCKKLPSSKFDNLYQMREGDWRILYAIRDDQIIVIILDVRRRDQAYRDI
jgi:mRNA interferase RelE/StbE